MQTSLPCLNLFVSIIYFFLVVYCRCIGCLYSKILLVSLSFDVRLFSENLTLYIYFVSVSYMPILYRSLFLIWLSVLRLINVLLTSAYSILVDLMFLFNMNISISMALQNWRMCNTSNIHAQLTSYSNIIIHHWLYPCCIVSLAVMYVLDFPQHLYIRWELNIYIFKCMFNMHY